MLPCASVVLEDFLSPALASVTSAVLKESSKNILESNMAAAVQYFTTVALRLYILSKLKPLGYGV
jgi:hypothetical protein